MVAENNVFKAGNLTQESNHLEGLRAELLAFPLKHESSRTEKVDSVQVAGGRLGDWLGDFWRKKDLPEKRPYSGPRDGSAKAIMGVAQERMFEELYRDGYMKITERGRLGCSIAVGTIYREAGVLDGRGNPLPLKEATANTRSDLLKAGWKLVDKSREELKPGYFVEAFGALDGGGAHHAIILGEPAKRGQKNPVTGKYYTVGEPMAWNNNDRTRPDKAGEEKLKWWSLESLAEATSEYSDYLVLRPPLAGEKKDPEAERRKVANALRFRR